MDYLMDYPGTEHNAVLDDVAEIPAWLVAGGPRSRLCTKRAVKLEGLNADRFQCTDSFWKERSYGRRAIELARLVRADMVG